MVHQYLMMADLKKSRLMDDRVVISDIHAELFLIV